MSCKQKNWFVLEKKNQKSKIIQDDSSMFWDQPNWLVKNTKPACMLWDFKQNMRGTKRKWEHGNTTTNKIIPAASNYCHFSSTKFTIIGIWPRGLNHLLNLYQILRYCSFLRIYGFKNKNASPTPSIMNDRKNHKKSQTTCLLVGFDWHLDKEEVRDYDQYEAVEPSPVWKDSFSHCHWVGQPPPQSSTATIFYESQWWLLRKWRQRHQKILPQWWNPWIFQYDLIIPCNSPNDPPPGSTTFHLVLCTTPLPIHSLTHINNSEPTHRTPPLTHHLLRYGMWWYHPEKYV